MTFRLAPGDARNVAAIANHMQADHRTPFVSRTDVLRAALRGYAAAVAVAKGGSDTASPQTTTAA